MASATPSALRLPLPYGSVMDPDMSMRNRNALGLFLLTSASYDMLPPFSHLAEPHLKGCVGRTNGDGSTSAGESSCGGYRPRPGWLEGNERRSEVAERGRRDAFATRCVLPGREEMTSR